LSGGETEQTYVGGIETVQRDYATFQDVISNPDRGGIVGCIYADEGFRFRTYSSGIYEQPQEGCNMAVIINGYGFEGPVEQQDLGTVAPDCNDTYCTLEPGTLRINPSLGNRWGQGGYATINAYATTSA